MKRVIIGEFENQKKIENILLKEKSNFGVFIDFESAIHLGLENYDNNTIVIYLEDMDVFNQHHTFICESKDNIRLLIKSKKVKKYRDILLNEGYSVIDTLEELDKIDDEKNKVCKGFNSPRIFMVSGSFEFAIRLAYHFSRMKKFKTLFIDTDSINSFTLKRLNLIDDEDLNYLNESIKNRRSPYSTICGNLAIAPVIENTDFASKGQLQQLINLLAENKAKFDIQIVYCNSKMEKLVGQISLISDQQLFIRWLNYESLMEMNKEKIQYGLKRKASVIGLKPINSMYNHLLTQKLCQLRIIGVVGSKEWSGLLSPYRIINLEKSSMKEKRIFYRVIKQLLYRERSISHD